jgi:hypothetical protein
MLFVGAPSPRRSCSLRTRCPAAAAAARDTSAPATAHKAVELEHGPEDVPARGQPAPQLHADDEGLARLEALPARGRRRRGGGGGGGGGGGPGVR